MSSAGEQGSAGGGVEQISHEEGELPWRDESGSQVVVLASPGDEPFDPESRTVLQVPVTSSPPALFASESGVFLVVPDTEGRLQMHESNDAGASFSLAATLPATVGSGAQPALVEHRPPSFGSAAWHLFWFDDGLSPELYVLSGDAAPGSLQHPVRLAGDNQQARVESPSPVAATNFLGQAHVAWNLDGYIRVARYTPGELATYGLTAGTY